MSGPAAVRVIALLVLLVACDTRHQRCVDNGGQWIAVNCREVDGEICNSFDFGNGVAITTCTPTTSTVCDHTCRGAAAEARTAP